MEKDQDIVVHLPAEHFSALSEVILMGLKEANISESDRDELSAWWQAESEFIRDELTGD